MFQIARILGITHNIYLRVYEKDVIELYDTINTEFSSEQNYEMSDVLFNKYVVESKNLKHDLLMLCMYVYSVYGTCAVELNLQGGDVKILPLLINGEVITK